MSAILNNPPGWQAYLQLTYAQQHQKTVLARRQHRGPLLVQRPFYPEGGVCHSYIIHPPGGVVGGDVLQIDVEVSTNAHALLTTPASGKFYNSQHKHAIMRQQLRVAEGAILEWLPQDNIFFEDSTTTLDTEVSLLGDARFIGWEISCLGRPFSHAPFDKGSCQQRIMITRDGKPVLVDRTQIQAGHKMLESYWGLAGYSVTGTLVATPVQASVLDELRTCFDGREDCEFSASLLGDVLVCRFLGHHGETARRVFEQAWGVIRPHMLGIAACSPRIWKT